MIQEDSIQAFYPLLLQPTDTATIADTDTADYLLACYDTISAPYKNNPIRHRESMFRTSQLSTPKASPMLRHSQPSGDWVFATIVVLIGIMSIYFNIHKFKLKDILQSIFDSRVMERVFRENNVRIISLMPMAAIYMASLAMCITKASSSVGLSITVSTPLFCMMTFAGITLFVLLKNVLIRFLYNIFDVQRCVTLYIYNNYLFYFLGALVAVPLTLLYYYSPFAENFMLHSISIFVVILFVVRLIRGLQLILTNHEGSKLYLFYYLCCLEIVPILVLIKTVIA